VTVEAPHKNHRQGNLYTVRVDLRFPGGEALANRAPSEDHAHEDVYVALRDAFKAARRQLQDRQRIRRGDVKLHRTRPREEAGDEGPQASGVHLIGKHSA
jgi:hypothetical protein